MTIEIFTYTEAKMYDTLENKKEVGTLSFEMNSKSDDKFMFIIHSPKGDINFLILNPGKYELNEWKKILSGDNWNFNLYNGDDGTVEIFNHEGSVIFLSRFLSECCDYNTQIKLNYEKCREAFVEFIQNYVSFVKSNSI